MPDLAPISRDGAVAEAVAIARGLGLDVEEPLVLNARHNLVVWLRPAPVVARVGWITSLVRGPERAAGSVRLAAFLSAAGEPVTPPTDLVDPGPHVSPSGCIVTLWRRLSLTAGPADPVEVGRGLRRIHAAAPRFRGPLEPIDPIGEAAAAARIAERHGASEAGRLLRLLDRLSMPPSADQPIHGDAGLHNAFVGPDGIVWGDWEECGRGPIEWDVATLTHRARMLGEQAAETAAAAEAYGPVDAAVLGAVEPVFDAWAIAWGALARIRDARPGGDLVERRLATLEAHVRGRIG